MLLSGCASVSPPDGGEKDTKPPQLIGSTPADDAVEVTGKSIKLRFDEPVTAAQLASGLSISPDTDLGIPTVKELGEELTVEFKKPFAPNTTYFVDFGEGITDITEKNKAARLKLSFSTGATIDTGSVQGKLINSWSNQPEKGATVGLYPASDTVNPGKQRPLYRTVTTDNGEYTLHNIRPGRYRLFGFVDNNKSQLFEEPERVTYAGRDFQVRESDTTIQLVSGRLDTRRPFVLSQKKSVGLVTLTYNEGIQRASVVITEKAGSATKEVSLLLQSTDSRTVKLFGRPREAAVKLTIISQDSAGNVGRDSVSVRFLEDGAKMTSGTGRKVSLVGQLRMIDDRRIIDFVLPVAGEVKSGVIGELRMAPPVAVTVKPSTPVTDSLKQKPPTEPVGKPVSKPAPLPVKTMAPISVTFPGMAVLDSSRTLLSVELPKSIESQPFQLLLDSTAISLVSNQPVTVKPTAIPIRDRDAAETTGAISVQLKTTQPSFAIDLLTEKGQIVETVGRFQSAKTGKANLAPIRWGNLAPGRYRVRVLIDADGNGRWDGVDPKLLRQPEPVWFYSEPLEVRANWENEAILAF